MTQTIQQEQRVYIHEPLCEQIVSETYRYSNSRDTISGKIILAHLQETFEYLMERLTLGFVIQTGDVLVPLFYEPETLLLQLDKIANG